MKNSKYIFLLFIMSVLTSGNIFSQDKWWQGEIPKPSSNQMVNQNYLTKKRELVKTLDELSNLARQRNDYVKAGQFQSVKFADEMLQFMGKKLNILENELSKIPIYVTNPNYTQSSSFQNTNNQTTDIKINQANNSNHQPVQSTNRFLLTLYKIENCDRTQYQTELEYIEASLNLFNELKGNMEQILESVITESSTPKSQIKQEINYYKLFISNWGNGFTIGTKEAQKEIISLMNELEVKERVIFKGTKRITANKYSPPILAEFKHSIYPNIYMNVEIMKLSAIDAPTMGERSTYNFGALDKVDSFIKNSNVIVARLIIESNSKTKELNFTTKHFPIAKKVKKSGVEYGLHSESLNNIIINMYIRNY